MMKVVIVTGASRGIGYQLCLSLARKGHRIVAVARSEESLLQLQQTNPDNIKSIPADLASEKEIKKLVARIKKDFSRVDILVNNAGALINKPFTELSLDDWRNLLNINVLSAIDLTRQLLPSFNKNAHIVNIGSMGGFQGSSKFPGLSAYSVSKGALSILSECLAVELADNQIKANTLCLGAVQTEMLNEAFPGINAPVSAEEMGDYIADFALNGSQYYNGQVLPVTIGSPG